MSFWKKAALAAAVVLAADKGCQEYKEYRTMNRTMSDLGHSGFVIRKSDNGETWVTKDRSFGGWINIGMLRNGTYYDYYGSSNPSHIKSRGGDDEKLVEILTKNGVKFGDYYDI